MKTITVASPRGFCAGVERAIAIVELTLAQYSPPVYVHHEVVHNKYVINSLKNAGAVFVDNIIAVPNDSIIVYSAHGVSQAVKHLANTKNLKLIVDATCPLVSKVHAQIKYFYTQGYQILLIGHAGHPEVEGSLGQVPNNVYLIETLHDISKLPFLAHEKVAVVTQTTLSVDDTAELIAKLKQQFINIRLAKTADICYATQNRQSAVKLLAQHCTAIIVLGSKTSSNATRLYELSQQLTSQAYLVDSITDIDMMQIINLNHIGLTAGASTPEILVQEAIVTLVAAGFEQVDYINHTVETITFPLPKALRELKELLTTKK